MSNDTTHNNKRIAKSTVVLYFRTLFVMLISLYTSRVILEVLRVENYSIYNVIGGVVTMFFCHIIITFISHQPIHYLRNSQGKQRVIKKSFLHLHYHPITLDCHDFYYLQNNWSVIHENNNEYSARKVICSTLGTKLFSSYILHKSVKHSIRCLHHSPRAHEHICLYWNL